MAGTILWHRHSRFKDITGQRFGRLVAVAPSEQPQYWNCKCDCGQDCLGHGSNMRYGKVKSCGCISREQCAGWAATRVRHGHARKGQHSSEYRSWSSMLRRCSESDKKHRELYARRGIQVCKRWRNSFDNFLADMGPKPTPEHTIERKDNNKGYDLGNCCWATKLEQQNNRRVTVFVTYRDRTLALSDWSRELGIKYGTLYTRLRFGWPMERVFTEPVRR